MASGKYSPLPAPQGQDIRAIVRWMEGELARLRGSLDAVETTTVNYGKEVQNVASGATLTVDWKAGQKQRVELGANCTLTFAEPLGVCNLMLRLVQDGTGGRATTFPSSVKWAGGAAPTWVTTTNAVTVLAMYYDGTNYHATASVDSK
jgi:hypothetical protein